MKVYAAIFIAVLSMPVATLVGIFVLEFGVVWGIRQAVGIGVAVELVALIVSIIIFLSGIPSTLRRLRIEAGTRN